MDPDGTSPQTCDLRAQTRLDGEDLLTAIKDRGYQYITTKDEMANITDGKVWGAFADGAFGYEIDQGEDSKQPTLAEMATKAIDLLNKDNDNGFFLMVEASHIDHGGHNNDPVTTVSEMNSWNDAMKVILDFAEKDGNTVVLSTSDHATGGLKIGSRTSEGDYSTAGESRFFEPLRRAKYTSDEIIAKIQNKEMTIKEGYKAYGLEPGIDDFSTFKMNTNSGVLKQQLTDKCGLAFTTSGHTGEDILIYAYSPDNDHPHGYLDNTELNDYMCHVLDLDLSETTARLFVNITKGLKDQGYSLEYDDMHDLTAAKGDTTIEIPANKDYITINGEQHQLAGVIATYYSSDLITYGSQEILYLAAEH